MKKLIIFWAVVLLSVPVLGQELARKYLDTRITLTEAAVAMPELCKALSEASGATIIPDEDWRVKERQMTIYCHDALLPHVMYSIVDVTRFMWNVKDENTYVLTYRADTDRLIGETQRKGEAAKADRGAALVENSMRHQGEDMNALRKNNPAAYLMKSTGLGDAIGKSLKASPQLFKSAASGEKRVFSGDEISPETLSGIDELNSLILELANDVCSARNVRVPGFLSDTLSKPVSRGNVEIEVNGDIPIGRDRKITSEQINTVCSGYAVVRTDGVITGVLPIVNTNSEITKNLAEAALDLIENPGKSFDEVFAGLDVNAFMGAIGRDLMSVNNVYKTDIPYAPAMLNVIDLGEDPKDLTDALMRLEAATKVPVFCDHFSDSGGVGANVLKLLNIGSLRQGTVYDVVSSLCDAYNLNMELANGHFDFSDIKWFEKIKAVVSKDTVSKWKNEYETTGYVSLDTLLEMGSFSPAQLSFALKSDASLAPLAGPLVNNANVLEMLSMCDGAALANMMGESGVRSGYLNKRAFNAYRSLYQTAGFSGRTGCRIRLGSDIADNTLTYRVEFVPDDGSGTKKVEFAIPLFKK